MPPTLRQQHGDGESDPNPMIVLVRLARRGASEMATAEMYFSDRAYYRLVRRRRFLMLAERRLCRHAPPPAKIAGRRAGPDIRVSGER